MSVYPSYLYCLACKDMYVVYWRVSGVYVEILLISRTCMYPCCTYMYRFLGYMQCEYVCFMHMDIYMWSLWLQLGAVSDGRGEVR